MSMRWVLTWKAADSPDDKSRKAKARLVVKGFIDPDLTTLRAESPPLSRLGKHLLFQIAASEKWDLIKRRRGDSLFTRELYRVES